MRRFPVIAAFGGVNPAGRSSGHHAYRRLVYGALDEARRRSTLASLAALCGKRRLLDEDPAAAAAELLDGTLIRRLRPALFDPERIACHRHLNLAGADGGGIEFALPEGSAPSPLPDGWRRLDGDEAPDGMARFRADKGLGVMLPDTRAAEVNSAGQLPDGFDPARTYPTRSHPRALQLTVFGASDAVNALGIDWEALRRKVPADRISVYAGNCLGQLDRDGYGGMFQARWRDRRVTSKQLALGLAEMPADFINAYLLGGMGGAGHTQGACATFLYNLRQGVRDIQTGASRVAVVGASESCLTPEAFEAFHTMGALASDAALRALDDLPDDRPPDHRRACRPFGRNCGFTLSEAAQFVILFDDELALETGAAIHGGVNEVFVNADGYKKSITGPGAGNFITMAKAAAATRDVIGPDGLRARSWVQAHGTGTPQNRTSESEIISRVARAFGIRGWPVAAVKSYLGHSVASAAGDQLAASLGVWADGIIPGILTVDGIADDVTQDHLDILLAHREVGAEGLDAALINSKGFGGNNATASVLAPHVVSDMLERRHGARAMRGYRRRNEAVREAAAAYDAAANAGENRTIYRFGRGVVEGKDIDLDPGGVRIAGVGPEVTLAGASLYRDMAAQD